MSSVKIITYCSKNNHVRFFFRYCIVLFDGDQYKMNNGITYTPAGGTSQHLATPFKKYYNSEDYVYCVTFIECSIYIKNQKMLTVQCAARSSIQIWVINKLIIWPMVMLIVFFLWFIIPYYYWCCVEKDIKWTDYTLLLLGDFTLLLHS